MTAVGGRFLVLFVEMDSSELTYRTILESERSAYNFQMRSNLSAGYLTIDFSPTFTLDCKYNIVPNLAWPYMPFWRALNSIALIKGSLLYFLIRQIYSSLPELT
jgi:hypothetical protein